MKTCVATGVTSGIGRATILKLSKGKLFKNYALIARNEEKLKKIKNLMIKNNHSLKIKCYVVDLECFDKLNKIILNIYKEFKSINCLLNIAGFADPKSLLLTDNYSFIKTYRVNVIAPFVLIRECVKFMKNSGGKILNIASTAGMSSRPGWLSYSSSKAALISMSYTLSDELSEYGIKIYCISPGRCATKLRKKLAPNEDQKKIMQPNDVAKFISNLLDPSEECLDGQNIVLRKKLNKN